MNVSSTWKNIQINCCWLLRKEATKNKALGNTWLSLSVCLLALSHSSRHERTTVLYVLCCSVHGRLKAVLLRLQYVDTAVFGTWFVPSWLAQKKKSRLNNNFFEAVCAPWKPCEYGLQIWWYSYLWRCLSKKSTFPAVMFTSRLIVPGAMTWTEKSACVANLPHTRAHFLVLLLWCCCIACGAATMTAACRSLVLSRHL